MYLFEMEILFTLMHVERKSNRLLNWGSDPMKATWYGNRQSHLSISLYLTYSYGKLSHAPACRLLSMVPLPSPFIHHSLPACLRVLNFHFISFSSPVQIQKSFLVWLWQQYNYWTHNFLFSLVRKTYTRCIIWNRWFMS